MHLKFTLNFDEKAFASDYRIALERAFARKLADRGCTLSKDEYPIRLSLDQTLPEGSFHLTISAEGAELLAADPCAVFAGLGEFLLGWHFGAAQNIIPARTMEFAPASPYRGLYFATHFYNFYHTAPLCEVFEQVEDVAFRGGNTIMVWYDMHHFRRFDEPDSVLLVDRLKAIMRHAQLIGMQTCMTMISNEAFMGTPDALKAASIPQNGYHAVLDGHYGVEICPSKPGGTEEILRQRRVVLRGFRECKPDYVVYWPYDQGGCTCKDCAPWGTNGFLRLYPYFRELLSEEMPDTKIIVSTWDFDMFTSGEWEAFHEKAEQGAVDGAAYLMDFFPRGKVPACIRDKGLPGSKEMLSFPEISMYGGKPWGGFGANPLPRFLQESNDGTRGLYSGITCYSEGIFEDINKTIMLFNASGRERDARKAIADYASLEWMTEDASDVIRLSELVEQTLPRDTIKTQNDIRYQIQRPEGVSEAAALARKIDRAMPEPARSGWRWRILYLRALIDEQLMKDDWRVTEKTDEYLHELARCYHITPRSLPVVSPPTIKVIQKTLHAAAPAWLSEEENGEKNQ